MSYLMSLSNLLLLWKLLIASSMLTEGCRYETSPLPLGFFNRKSYTPTFPLTVKLKLLGRKGRLK